MIDSGDRNIEDYCKAYIQDYGFERIMIEYRQRLVIDRLKARKPRTVIEVGCGSELVYEKYLRSSEPADFWVIVEPSEVFARL